MGLINVIVVKDLSRIGRNYIEVGNILEQEFPMLNIRVIAINDNFDSDDYEGTTAGLAVVIKMMTYDMYRGRFMNVMKEMGFKGLTPHCTRHTFSTQAKRCGMDAGIRKRIMGHSLDKDVTESVYTHPTFRDLVHEMNKLDFSVMEYV